MFIEVEVEEGANCPLFFTKMFAARENPRVVSWAKVVCPDGQERTCRVTGWSSEGPCNSYTVPVDDSGEGIVTLVYGGDQGIRLQREESKEPWDLNSSNQWGEAYLLLDKDVALG